MSQQKGSRQLIRGTFNFWQIWTTPQSASWTRSTVWPDIIVPLHVPVIQSEMTRYNCSGSGYPNTRISGNPDFRISGYPDIRTSGYPEIRKSGNPDIRISGNWDIRISGYPSFPIYLDFRISRSSTAACVLAPRH